MSEDKIDEKFKWQKEHVHKKDLLSKDKIAQSDCTMKNPESKSVFGPGFYGNNPTIEKVENAYYSAWENKLDLMLKGF